MNLLIQKSNNKTSNVVKLEMLSTEFSSTIKLIKENEIPVIVFTDTNESFLINNINDIINNAKVNTEVLFEITENDLISLGSGGSSEPVDSRPYKVYTALLTQSETDAPVATVLENTLGGEVVWSYMSEGFYKVSFENTSDKLSYKIGSGIDNSDIHNLSNIGVIFSNVNELNILTYQLDTVTFKNNCLLKTPIEIRVYN